MDYRKSYHICRVGVIIGLFVVIFAGGLLRISQAAYLGLGIAGAAVVQGAVFCRCPQCKKPLPTLGARPDRCPFCGRELEV